MMRPRQLATWCLADYVAKIDVVYPKKEKSSHDMNEELREPDEVEDDLQNVLYNDEGNFPI